ncbi:hypothetical protein BDV24DRAFT_84016 [Aspergillus arachidicola]|uniref:Uncharacterized protein n=1 Tax=Aspergillus arachidicola TaxID=656916 RepID=A0A5N6Y013_9EURO|nr:hypothetical protein BDV24DRAFT_84016 [Aspergillus arachidicola]
MVRDFLIMIKVETNLTPQDRLSRRKPLYGKRIITDLSITEPSCTTGCKGPKFPTLIHPYESQNVDSLAFIFRFLETFLKPHNTFMRLDNQGNRVGREIILRLGHFEC